MTNSALARLDAVIHRRLAAAGLAEKPASARYSVAGVAPFLPVRCYVDRGMQTAGEFGPVAGSRIVVGLLRADVPEPIQGATVELMADGLPIERFTLEAPDASSDESLSRWVVSHG
jgi:hypothetical protein